MTEIVGLRVQRHNVQGSGPLRRGGFCILSASSAPRIEKPTHSTSNTFGKEPTRSRNPRKLFVVEGKNQSYPHTPITALTTRSLPDVDRFSKQMASAKSKKFSRPETDYERWLRGQDEHYEPGDQPIYGPPVQGVDDPIENGKGKHPAISRFFGLTGYSVICSIVLSVLLTIIIIRSAKVLRKRRHRSGEISLSGKARDK